MIVLIVVIDCDDFCVIVVVVLFGVCVFVEVCVVVLDFFDVY